jgi:large subunit ribosomal protein L22
MEYKYSFQKLKDAKANFAKALGREMPVSVKQAIEISNYIRHNNVAVAKKKLEDAISMKKAIPFKRFTNGLGHKKGKGMAAGRYVVKASGNILNLLKSAESNAVFKGMNSKNLVIAHMSVQQAPTTWHYGRHHRREMKRCHIEIVLEDKGAQKAEKTADAKEQKKN